MPKGHPRGHHLRVATDCSGIEAPIQALVYLGVPFDHLWSSEKDPMVRKSLQANFSPRKLYTDIYDRDVTALPSIDLYIAGFPCQPFSSIGKRRGMSDRRGHVFLECLRTIQSCRPRAFILENVKGLLHHDHGRTFATILQKLHDLRAYHIHYQVLNTADYGIPHHRERIYIVGILKKKGQQGVFRFPEPIPLEKTIVDYLETSPDNEEQLGFLTPHKRRLLRDLVSHKKIDSLNEPWLVNLNVSEYTRTGAKKHVCPCLLAGEGGNCVYYLTSLRRRLTPREYLRLQGFPDTFRICIPPRLIYKQAGNAMSVNVLYFLLDAILKHAFA